jgi:hypothetical protein
MGVVNVAGHTVELDVENTAAPEPGSDGGSSKVSGDPTLAILLAGGALCNDALLERDTLAIAVHNILEGLAISLVLVPRGVSWSRAAFWSVFSSLPQPLMAVPAFVFVETFKPLLPYGLGFAAGAMIWMVFSELMPDALDEASANLVAIIITLSVLAMVAFQVLIR